MPTLNWMEKEAVVNHHHQIAFHLLKDVLYLACGQPGDVNLVVKGDNLVALKVPIDPPYNTEKEHAEKDGFTCIM